MTTTKFLGLKVRAQTGRVGCIVMIAAVLFSMILGGICIPYCMNSWLAWAGRPATFPWYAGAMIGILPYFGFGSVLAAIVTFFLSFFIS